MRIDKLFQKLIFAEAEEVELLVVAEAEKMKNKK